MAAAFGLPPFLAEAMEKGWPRPRIVAHRDVAARFDRYRATAGYNGLINARQFSRPSTWPVYSGAPKRPPTVALVRSSPARRQPASLVETVNALLASEVAPRDWPLRHYSRDCLFSVTARRGWVEPRDGGAEASPLSFKGIGAAPVKSAWLGIPNTVP